MLQTEYDIVVAGGGAAGFFAAIHAADGGKNRVAILEKTGKLLQKVKISGGGRCNVTHSCKHPSQLVKFYPRGGKKLRKSFDQFAVNDTIAWFESRGVRLKTEDDGRMFPVTDNSQTIIDCLLKEAEKSGVDILTKNEVTELKPQSDGFLIKTTQHEIIAQKIIVTTGGHHHSKAYQWLEKLNLKVAPPIPSLFTFNVPDSKLKELQGLSVQEGKVSIPGTKWEQDGPILITHWGFSGPAIIKLSAMAAIDLHKIKYDFPVHINWSGLSEKEIREQLKNACENHPKRKIIAHRQFEIPARLWEALCINAGIASTLVYGDLRGKLLNKLIEILLRDTYDVKGRTAFKEEFVTAGGIELSEIDLTSYECKKIPGLYFAGEILNVDGFTGGFNFQHAWTSGYLAGNAAGH